MEERRADIIVVTYGDMFTVLKRAVDSLYRFASVPFRLIIVNNGSKDGTLTAFSGLPGCEVINLPENLGMVRAFNLGLKRCTAPYIARMDHDVEFVGPWQEKLFGDLERDPSAGAAGPRVMTSEGRIYAALFHFFFKVPGLPLRFPVKNALSVPGVLRRFVHFDQHSMEPDDEVKFGVVRPVYHVTGTFSLMRRAAVEKIGPADEAYSDGNGAYEDLDYTLRMTVAGFRVLYDGRVKVVHHCSRPEGRGQFTEPGRNRDIFKKKWGFL